MPKGLGRHKHFDMRAARHLMRDHLRSADVLPDHKVWEVNASLDQGSEGSCVGHGWAHWHNAKPKGYQNPVDHSYAVEVYERAKEVDPWPGTDYEGTATDAGAKVMRERGLLDSFVWATGIDEIRAWVLAHGPVVMGTDWLESMDEPTRDGYLRVNESSPMRGGHCWLLYGVDKAGHFVCQNSWGQGYAREGSFLLWPGGLEKLVRRGAEAVTSAQVGVA